MQKKNQIPSDEAIQEKNVRYSATLTQNKLLLQIDHNVTYKGQIESTPYFDLNQLKTIFQNGKFEVLCKTTSKMSIKIGILKIQLQSEENRQLQELKTKIKELEQKLKNKSQLIVEEDLNSTANFDINCIYKITVSGVSYISSYVTSSTLTFVYNGGAIYTTSNTNRKANTGFGTVIKMTKLKCGFP